jgi:hypothetical protein
MEVSTSFIFIVDEAFKYGDGANFWGYVVRNAEPLCRILYFCATLCLSKLFNFLPARLCFD